MQSTQNPWKKLSTKTIHETPWVRVDKHEVIQPSGDPGEYTTIHFKVLAIGIIPLDEEYNTWIVGQYRFPLNKYCWEIPEGGGELTIPPLETAKRELKEETGITAKKWEKVLEFHLSNASTDELSMVYVAKDLEFGTAEPEDCEDITIKRIPFKELVEMVMNGEITDSVTVAAVLKTKLLIDRGKI